MLGEIILSKFDDLKKQTTDKGKDLANEQVSKAQEKYLGKDNKNEKDNKDNKDNKDKK